ncbi:MULTISPECIES: ABC transporter permease [unclassified Corynebacterium]|uniref:ABC transporter permease n=1 Tax=unclassified Corynebacterium TaxID=2624378 RepID=UPI0029CA9479|nr:MULTISPECIES: ABC transporter permease [unclassified Corynebacterium]WPF65855.1 ABC transporter permease [Corynebacterium sp. 22KM0430]WPF68348.1 ABC transporter permease [Corynebacterium sp. 21KM1197]
MSTHPATSTSPASPQEPAQTPQPEKTPWSKALLIGLAATAVVTLALLAFSWPSYTATPKNLPVSVVASESAYTAMTQTLAQQDSPFDLSRAESREEATRKIEQRESYGAFILPSAPGEQMEVLTSPAANNSIATMLGTAGTTMHKQQVAAALESGQAADPQASAALTQQALKGPTITPVSPLSEDDPQGSGLAVAAFPLILGGIIGGVLISLTVRGAAQRFTAILAYSTIAASALLFVLHTWFGFLPTASLPLWGALALGLGATASLVTGLHSLLGTPGIGLGAIITVFIANPISGATLPLEFLPWHFEALGRVFVPGATQELLRNLSYFPEASNTQPWLVLSAWAVFGLLCLAAKRR